MAELKESDVDRNPYVQFERWFAEARAAQPVLPEGMTVATADKDGVVSARVCLLKSFDQHGFVFFTNYSSRKGDQISENPRVSLCFWWPALERQVRVEGAAVKVNEEESEAYFATRPRGSQIGAWASDQSRVLIGGRSELESRFAEMETTYRDKVVPRPPHWGGYRVIPNFIEFWQGQANRRHDRFVYRLRADANDWVIERLAP
ncbi:MAG TPA: pyridoxamine 5'-phosphate oxidase [Thermoanaerobaculia bacterium]|nr:pyridoxamine 5'-phosphate oxidase [Thermoanaerobaculia bacterium]